MDRGRQADLASIEKTLSDPSTPNRVRDKAQKAKEAIQDQSNFKTVSRDREHLVEATRRGDREAVEKYTAKLERADKDLGYYTGR